MLLDVHICTCIKIQLSGVIMIGSITLKGRFGEKLWSNWRCISLSFDAGRSFFLVLPVYFNRRMKAMLVSSIINIFDGKFTSANLLASAVLPTFFAGQVGYTAMYSMYYFIYSIMCILFFSWSHENSLKGSFSAYYHRHTIRLS